jgi:LysR family cyn operon transcriptional activator
MNRINYSVQDRFPIKSIGITNSWVIMLLRHIRYLLAVAEHANFTRAAQALHVSQPTLSLQIRQVEEMLGAQLFDRSGRTVRLTDAGEVYLHHARRALLDLEEGRRAIHDVQDLARGSLRLAMTPTFTAYLIGPLIERFNAAYPGIAVDVREMPQDRMEEALAEDRLDLGIAFAELCSDEMDSQPLYMETLSLVVGHAHPLAVRRKPLTAAAFEAESLVMLSQDFATRRYIDAYCQMNGIAPKVFIESNSVSAIIEIVRGGRLATVLPDAVASGQAGLHAVPLVAALPSRTAALLTRRDAYLTAACKAFIALALREFGSPASGK